MLLFDIYLLKTECVSGIVCGSEETEQIRKTMLCISRNVYSSGKKI